MKLFPGKPVLGEGGGTLDFPSAREARASPLARGLFLVPGVRHVFFGADFVSVTLREEDAWEDLRPEVMAAISEFYSSGKAVLDPDAALGADDANTTVKEGDDSTVILIKDLLETRVRPAVQDDGGDIAYVGFSDGIVRVRLKGSCVGCPSSSITLKQGVQNLLMHYIPEVMSVEEVGDADASGNENEELELGDHADKLKELGF